MDVNDDTITFVDMNLGKWPLVVDADDLAGLDTIRVGGDPGDVPVKLNGFCECSGTEQRSCESTIKRSLHLEKGF